MAIKVHPRFASAREAQVAIAECCIEAQLLTLAYSSAPGRWQPLPQDILLCRALAEHMAPEIATTEQQPGQPQPFPWT